MKNLAVLVSGKSSLLGAMVEEKLEIKLVVADRRCPGLGIAKNAGISRKLLERKGSGSEFDRRAYTKHLVGILLQRKIDFIAMAGFMTILDPIIFHYYRDKILNIHPALLPSFKGGNAVRDALAFGVKVTGTTIHIATEKLDEGRIIKQAAVSVFDGDDEATLHERIKRVERHLYPLAIREFAETI